MAIIANTFKTYEAKGIREDLADVIYNISPTDTPFMSNVGRSTAKNTLFEWQTDSLAATDTTNKQLEGDDVAAFDAVTPTVRVANYQQISRKTLIVGETEQVVDKAGRKSEWAYQIAKKGSELKRDMEAILCGQNQAAAAGAAGVARATASLSSWIRTNTSNGGGAAAEPAAPNPTPGTARVDGTQRVFTEAMLKTSVQKLWAAGADVDSVFLMVGGTQKQNISGFAGIATKTYNLSGQKKAVIIGAADVYVSDFGTFTIVPNRFQRNRDAFYVDAEYVDVAYLRPFKKVDLAKTGDADKAMLIVEYGLKVKNEGALAGDYDLS